MPLSLKVDFLMGAIAVGLVGGSPTPTKSRGIIFSG